MRTRDRSSAGVIRPWLRAVSFALIAAALLAAHPPAAGQEVTTYYPTFGAETPNSPGTDSGGHVFAEYWESTCGLFNLSGTPETVTADEVLGDRLAPGTCGFTYTYRPGEGGFAPCAFFGLPNFVRLRHSPKITVDAQLIRYRVACWGTSRYAGLPQGYTSLPTYGRLFQAGERTTAGPVELRTQAFQSDCATPNQVYNRRINVTLANYGHVPATFTIVAYPFRRFDGPYEPVWSENVVVDARSVRQVNDVQIPRTINDYDVNRKIGSMSVWLTITSDQPYLGYVSSVFEGGEPGSLPFQVFPLRGAETAASSP